MQKSLPTIVLTLLLQGTALPLAAAATPTPEAAEGVTVVSVSDAARLLEQPSLVVVDVRSPINYGRGHLPGARLLPYRGESANTPDFDASQDTFDTGQLPSESGAKLLVYSHGVTGWKSYKAAVIAAALGHLEVYWLREGYGGWEAAGLPTER